MNPLDFAAPVESALQHSGAPDQAKEAPRIKIREATRKAVRPLLNVKKEAWKELKGDRTIRILQADKGNATVVLNATEYDKKVNDLLQDKDSSCQLKKAPTQGTEKSLLLKLQSLKRRIKSVTIFMTELGLRMVQVDQRRFMDLWNFTNRQYLYVQWYQHAELQLTAYQGIFRQFFGLWLAHRVVY